jgi:Cu-processing system permease protein
VTAVRVLSGHEFRGALRNRWLLAYAVVFAALALGVSLIGMRLVGAIGLEGYGRTTASLINLCLSLVPLVAMLLGSVSLTGDRETGALEGFLAQPLDRTHLLFGRFIGALGAVAVATLIGFGVAGLLIGLATGAAGGLQYLAFLGTSVALASAYLAIGTLIGVLVRNRVQAVAAALGIWFASVAALDLALIGFGALTGASAQALAAALLLNPTQVARILALLVLDPTLEILGPVGGYLVARMGSTGAAALLLAALAAWSVGPFVAAAALFERRDPLP